MATIEETTKPMLNASAAGCASVEAPSSTKNIPAVAAKNRNEYLRLSENDVLSIFESLHRNKPPPPGLPFSIVPPTKGQQWLSPPSLEFPGAYTS